MKTLKVENIKHADIIYSYTSNFSVFLPSTVKNKGTLLVSKVLRRTFMVNKRMFLVKKGSLDFYNKGYTLREKWCF